MHGARLSMELLVCTNALSCIFRQDWSRLQDFMSPYPPVGFFRHRRVCGPSSISLVVIELDFAPNDYFNASIYLVSAGLNGVDSTRNPIQSESAFLMRGSSGTAEDAARKKKPEGDVRSVGEKSTSIDIWLEFMTLFPGEMKQPKSNWTILAPRLVSCPTVDVNSHCSVAVRMKSALSCCLTLLLFILGIVLLGESDVLFAPRARPQGTPIAVSIA